MTLHVTHMYCTYKHIHITHIYAFQSETSAFVGRAQKKVQAGCIYASSYVIPFVEIRGGSIPTGACVACLPALLLPHGMYKYKAPLLFSDENPHRPKEKKTPIL